MIDNQDQELELQRSVAEEYVADKTKVAKKRKIKLRDRSDREARIHAPKSPIVIETEYDSLDLRRITRYTDLPEDMRL